MNDLIDRVKAIENMHKQFWYRMQPSIQPRLDDWILALPSAQPERKTGKWEKYEGRFDFNYECSECSCSSFDKTDYCPQCGAKMEVEQDEKSV